MSGDNSIHVWIEHEDALVAAGATAVLRSDRTFLVTDRSPGLMAACRGAGPDRPAVLIADYETGIRQARAHRGSKILILTHLDGEVHVRGAVECGIRGYLHLRCTADALRQAVSALHHGATAFSPFVTTRIAESVAHENLTEREVAVMGLLALGLSNKAIGNRLSLSVGTVKTHVKSIFRKLDVSARAEALAVAHRRGLVGSIGAQPRPLRPQIRARSDWATSNS